MGKKIKSIFKYYKLEKADKIEKINIGFSNIVYSINDKFILKICGDKENEENFEKEVFFYSLFKNKLPIPEVIIYDNSKKLHNNFFMIYKKIPGYNLYSKWHLMTENQRRNIIKELCNILKKINNSDFKENINWHDKIINSIQKSLKEIEEKKLISKNFIKAIKDFTDKNHKVLNEQKIALVYWDTHFDNILVENNSISGLLDFERTEIASIDFILDIKKRMIQFPKKYMSEESEKFGKKKDYKTLLKYFKEFYPEAFGFKNLNKRLKLYSIEHDLKDLIGRPEVQELKEIIAKTIKYKLKLGK